MMVTDNAESRAGRAATSLAGEAGQRLRNYYRGLNNYQYYLGAS